MAGNDKIPTRTFTITRGGETFTQTVTPGDFGSVTDIVGSLEQTEAPTAGSPQPTENSSSSTASAAASVTQTQTAPSSTPSTLATSTIPTQSSLSGASAAPESSGTSSAANGSNGETPQASSSSCNSISCNAGLKAAIAVPVVVGTLLIIALIFLCLRRRKRRQVVASETEKRQKKPKKWSRHLRIFSFDAELLMGGRFSSSNSLRTGETGSQRSGGRRAHNASPSLHSVDEEVAPPYRDAVSHAQPPSTVPMATGMASRSPDPFPRPESSATAPPPYPAASTAAAAAGLGGTALATNLSRATSRASTTNQTPVSTRSLNDPFRNDVLSPVSPVDGGADGSPFIDPPEENRSPISPSESVSRRLGEDYEDAQSTISSVADVREAQIGRTLSTRNGRRV